MRQIYQGFAKYMNNKVIILTANDCYLTIKLIILKNNKFTTKDKVIT